ncbi:MAG: hypothetical protein PVH18_13095 [Chloroflexota bacterium]
MNRSKAFQKAFALTLIAVLTCFAAIRGRTRDAQAAVTLLYFQGEHNGDSVLLEWATATELSTAYFFLERATTENGPFEMLAEIGIVPSEAPPDGLSGAVYQRVDQDNVTTDQTYWYVLVEVESGAGAENRTEPIRVASGDAQPTATLTPTSTSTPTATPTATGTTSGSPSAANSPTPSTTPSTANPTATVTSARTLAGRPTTTIGPAQTTPQATSFGPTTVDQEENDSQAQSEALVSTGDTPQSVAEARGSDSESAQPPYPPATSTLQISATKSYPEPPGPRQLSNGTPVPNIGSANQDTSDNRSDEVQAPNNSPLLGTLFLWIGFAAALIIFISAVAGAIYYFRRQRSGNS